MVDADMDDECYVPGDVATFLRLVRLAGLAPLQFDRKGKEWRVRLSHNWKVYGYFMITVINTITIISLVTELQMPQEQTVRMRSNTQRAVWTVQACFMVLISGAAVCSAPGQMRAMIDHTNQVQKINAELNIHHLPNLLEKKMVWIMVIQAVACVILTMTNYMQTIYAGVQIKEDLWINAVYLFYVLSFWIIQLRNLQFIIAVLYVKYSFKIVNENLKTVLTDQEKSNNTSLSEGMVNIIKKYKRLNNYVGDMNVLREIDSGMVASRQWSDHYTVRRLALVFGALCDVVRHVDRSHGFMVLLMLTNILLHLICTPSSFFTYLLDKTKGETSSEAINFANKLVYVQLLWCCYHVFNLVIIIEPCHQTHMEMKVTSWLVGRLMRCSRSIHGPLEMELEQFFRYLVLNNVAYEPLRLAKMTRTLIFTLLSSITTYTIVILNL